MNQTRITTTCDRSGFELVISDGLVVAEVQQGDLAVVWMIEDRDGCLKRRVYELTRGWGVRDWSQTEFQVDEWQRVE